MREFLDVRWHAIGNIVRQHLLTNIAFNVMMVLTVPLLTLVTHLFIVKPSDVEIFYIVVCLFGVLLLTAIEITQLHLRYYFYQLLPVTLEETIVAQCIYRVVLPSVLFLFLLIIPVVLFDSEWSHWSKAIGLFFSFRLFNSSLFALLSTIKSFYKAQNRILAFFGETLTYLIFIAFCFFVADGFNDIVSICLNSLWLGLLLWLFSYWLLRRHTKYKKQTVSPINKRID